MQVAGGTKDHTPKGALGPAVTRIAAIHVRLTLPRVTLDILSSMGSAG